MCVTTANASWGMVAVTTGVTVGLATLALGNFLFSVGCFYFDLGEAERI